VIFILALRNIDVEQLVGRLGQAN